MGRISDVLGKWKSGSRQHEVISSIGEQLGHVRVRPSIRGSGQERLGSNPEVQFIEFRFNRTWLPQAHVFEQQSPMDGDV